MTERDRFDRCLPLILAHEGGYVDHRSDPGGATNLGVTLAVAKEFGLDKDGDGDVDKIDVRALKPADVARVYRSGYWLKALCDRLPSGIDYLHFDTAVNMGPGRAAQFLQEAVGVTVDRNIGPMTLAAVARASPASLVRSYVMQRRAFYEGLPTFKTFGKGWLRRLDEVRAQAEAWVE